jgi:tetratricopeptide (TPR) repeat protein
MEKNTTGVGSKKRNNFPFSFMLVMLVSTVMCGSGGSGTALPKYLPEADGYFAAGTKEQQAVFVSLFSLLNNETENSDEQFSLVREIANEFSKLKEYNKLANFLTIWVREHPGDGFNTYYLFMTAYAYVQMDAYPVAALYFDEIVKNYPDLIVRGDSIHFICLKQLIELTLNPEQRIWYYNEIITRFPDRVDLASTYFMLGQTYEEVGEWNRAIAAYTEFLPYYQAVIPGFPNAYSYAKQMIDFNNSQKNWTFESLPVLLETITSCLETNNIWRLWQYRAKVDFFARSWAQQEADDMGMAEFNLSSFSSNSKLHYASELSSGSNANEAYLRPWGWSQFTSTWYFYFRKVYFPLDPEIHGHWEWVGIYYGEKF